MSKIILWCLDRMEGYWWKRYHKAKDDALYAHARIKKIKSLIDDCDKEIKDKSNA